MPKKTKIGRPALPAQDRRADVLRVRLTEDEIECIDKMAKTAGCPVSELVRAALFYGLPRDGDRLSITAEFFEDAGVTLPGLLADAEYDDVIELERDGGLWRFDDEPSQHLTDGEAFDLMAESGAGYV